MKCELRMFYISIEIQSGSVNKCGCKAREWESWKMGERRENDRESWKIWESDRERACE